MGNGTVTASRRLALATEIGKYWDDPEGFVRDCFDWSDEADAGPDEWQAEFLRDLGKAVRERNFDGRTPVEPIRFAVASGHGIGKSTLMAWIFWWIMSTRPDSKGRVTANTYTQLETTTWAEIQKWGKRFRAKSWFVVAQSKIYHVDNKEGWFAIPITCAEENSEAFAGQHNRESTSFFLFDESSLIPDVIWDVAEAGLTDGEPMLLAFGNPTRNTGKFYEIAFGSARHRWNARSIDARYCKFPNKDQQAEWIADYGLDSDFCRVRICGIAPVQSEEQLISRSAVEAAQRRSVETLHDDPLVAGVDVPDGGSAWFVVRFRRGVDARPGPRIPLPFRVAGSKISREGMVTKLAEIMSDRDVDRRVTAMFVDSAFGAAIVERLHVLGHANVHEVRFAEKSPNKEYTNMRAFMWAGGIKTWLETGALDKNDKKLLVDLCGPGYSRRVGGDGGIIVESKDEMRDRGVPSPDDGDAFALTFARRVSPVRVRREELVRPVRLPGPYAPFS